MKLGKIGSRSMFGWRNPYVTDGLVAYWDGEWNVGGGVHGQNSNKWKNLISSDGDLTMPLASSFEIADKCVRFNGTGYATSAPTNIIQASLRGTFEIVVQRGVAASGEFRNIFSCGNMVWWRSFGSTSGGPIGASAYLSSAAGFRRYSMPNVDTVELASYAFVFDKDNTQSKAVTRLYRNGSSKTNFSFPASYGRAADIPTSDAISIGSGDNRDGVTSIYCVRVYDRNLTAAEISANYAVDKARFNLP